MVLCLAACCATAEGDTAVPDWESVTYIANDAFEQCNLQVIYGYSDFAWEFAEESNVLYYDMWKITGNS